MGPVEDSCRAIASDIEAPPVVASSLLAYCFDVEATQVVASSLFAYCFDPVLAGRQQGGREEKTILSHVNLVNERAITIPQCFHKRQVVPYQPSRVQKLF